MAVTTVNIVDENGNVIKTDSINDARITESELPYLMTVESDGSPSQVYHGEDAMSYSELIRKASNGDRLILKGSIDGTVFRTESYLVLVGENVVFSFSFYPMDGDVAMVNTIALVDGDDDATFAVISPVDVPITVAGG